MASVTERWRWRLIRRRRFRQALAALREGRPRDALQELTHAGAVGDGHAEALTAIAVVTAVPSLPNAAQCVTVVERVGHALDRETLAVATSVLAPLLWLGPGDQPEFVADVAELTDRFMSVTGPLPWGQYNLAVHALQKGDFGEAADRLAAGAAAPSGGWPIALLGAICAVLRGEHAALTRCLTGPVIDSDVVDDHRFLAGVHTVFECLRQDRPVDTARLGAVFSGPSGQLTRTVPQLPALKILLTDAVQTVVPRVNPADLGECVWGRWLADRLHYAGDEATDVLSAYATAQGDEPALIWQRLGSQQDLLALLPEQTARAVRQDLIAFSKLHTSDAAWARLVEQRARLGEAKAEATPAPEPGLCPWWPDDGPLQTVARVDHEVERSYIAGRQALRHGLRTEARQWFAQARARLAGDGMATRLVALRFGPLLDYWEGVTLAHLGLADEAAGPLRACANGVKAREARAQLGLLAVATGNHAEAASLLATITAPRPVAADYLAAVMAAHGGDAIETARLVEGIEERESAAGVYVAAGHRLRGRVHEAADELTDAVQQYRQALTRRPEDSVAAARLARVWLRQRYDDTDVPTEQLLDRQWSALTGVEWATALPFVRDCLAGSTAAHDLLNRVPADPGLRLLAIRSAVAAGEESRAVTALQAWVAVADDPDPRLVLAAHVLRAAPLIRDLCLANGQGPARSELAELTGHLRGTADPVGAFWAEAAQLILNPESVATASPLAAVSDESRSAPMRLFAGLMAVFSDDPDERQAGARACLTALEAEPVKASLAQAPVPRAAVRCLAADALSDDREFLAAYREIETEARALPCGPAAGYLAAIEARLRVGDLGAVIDGFIPEQLADLADPGVRRAMGTAYARRAVRLADGDPRAALRDLDQARELLGGTT